MKAAPLIASLGIGFRLEKMWQNVTRKKYSLHFVDAEIIAVLK